MTDQTQEPVALKLPPPERCEWEDGGRLFRLTMTGDCIRIAVFQVHKFWKVHTGFARIVGARGYFLWMLEVERLEFVIDNYAGKRDFAGALVLEKAKIDLEKARAQLKLWRAYAAQEGGR